MRKLSANDVKKATVEKWAVSEPAGEYPAGCDCPGSLILVVTVKPTGERLVRWVYRLIRDGKRYKFGLGRYDSAGKAGTSLAQARAKAASIADDPDAYRASQENKKGEEEADNRITCAELFSKWIDFQKARRQWGDPSTISEYQRNYRRLTKYAGPVIGNMLPGDVTVEHVAKVLNNIIRLELYATVDDVRSVLSGFFKWCMVVSKCRPLQMGNPTDGTLLRELLMPIPADARQHHPMCALADLPRFVRLMCTCSAINTAAGLALLFQILTGSRFSNIGIQQGSAHDSYARWSDIDLEANVWRIPSDKMKVRGNGAHIVPLSKQAREILDRLCALGIDGKPGVFVNRQGNPISHTAVRKVLERISRLDREAGGNGYVDPNVLDRSTGKPRVMTPHGVSRASFETWCQEQGFSADLQEKALHHTSGAIREAYMRSDLIEQRRAMMQAWADYCFSECPTDWTEIKPVESDACY